MGEVAYTSRVRIVRERGPNRIATLPTDAEIPFGVHGAVAEHYGVSMQDFDPRPTTLDHVVAAAGG